MQTQTFPIREAVELIEDMKDQLADFMAAHLQNDCVAAHTPEATAIAWAYANLMMASKMLLKEPL